MPAEDVQRADATTQADVGIDIKMPNFLPFDHPSDREAEVQTDHQQANVVTEAKNVIRFSVGDTTAGLENTVANGSRTDSSTVTATTDSRTRTDVLQVDRQGVQHYMRPLMAELCTHPEVLHDLCQDDPNSAFGGQYRSDTECSSDVDYGSNQSMASQKAGGCSTTVRATGVTERDESINECQRGFRYMEQDIQYLEMKIGHGMRELRELRETFDEWDLRMRVFRFRDRSHTSIQTAWLS